MFSCFCLQQARETVDRTTTVTLQMGDLQAIVEQSIQRIAPEIVEATVARLGPFQGPPPPPSVPPSDAAPTTTPSAAPNTTPTTGNESFDLDQYEEATSSGERISFLVNDVTKDDIWS